MRLSVLSAISVAALIVAGCGNESADADGDGTITQEEVDAKIKSEMGSVSIKPGKWENTVEFTSFEFDESKIPPEAKGMVDAMMKGMVGQKMTTSECITPEEASKPEAKFFSGNNNQDCDYKDFNMSGGKMRMEMSCKNRDGTAADMVLTGTYADTSFTMNMEVDGDSGEMGPVRMTAEVVGKRVGECG
ncbi:MAG: DUF3617 domain-containing protein [Pseudomonadota bacterium]